MKKFSILLVLILLAVMIAPGVHAAGTASMQGPNTVRAGDTITVSFVAGGGILGCSGTVSYDTSVLTLKGYKQVIGGSWAVEFSGNNFVAYDNALTSPINGSATIFQATFTVNASVATGAAISVSATNVVTSDGKGDTHVGTCTYSTTIAAPLSGNNQLATLNVANADISPAFAPSTIHYTASVPFSTSSLQVNATAADSKAKVSIDNPALIPGATTLITIKVTAENGAVREYTISVARAQDPNYVKSSNADLKALQVEGFPLSPAFSANVSQYYVWLPYEQETVSVSAAVADGKATLSIQEPAQLIPGQGNAVTVTVTAEDGSQRVYTVTAVRAPAHSDVDAYLNGQREPIPEVPTEPEQEPTEAPTEPIATPTEPVTAPTELDDSSAMPKGADPVMMLVIGIVCLVAGGVIGLLIGKKRK